MPARKNSKTSPRSIKMNARIKEALEYRREGYSYDEIAEYMSDDHPGEKIYKQKVANWINRGMKDIYREEAEHNYKLDLERLDAVFRAAYANAIQGDLQSINAVLGIIDRRAKMLGYDALLDQDLDAGVDESVRPIRITLVDKRRRDRRPLNETNPPDSEQAA